MSEFERLRRMGVTNDATEDLGTLAMSVPRYTAQAYCTSNECCKYPYMNPKGYQAWKRHPKVPKLVNRNQNYCPDCGLALFFK